MRRVSNVLLILMVIFTTTVYASKQSELEKIASKIANLKKYLTQKHVKKKSLTTELSTTEKKIAAVNFHLHNFDKNFALQKKALRPLQQQQQQYESKLQQQQLELGKQIRAAYQMGQHSYLQLLLSQQQPSEISRMSVYYQAISHARANLIQDFLQNLEKIKINQASINAKLLNLQKLKAEKVLAEKQLLQQQQQRKKLIAKINAQIKNSQQRISQLQANKKQLQNVVNNLNAKKAYQKFTGVAFSRLRHRSPWPVKGRVTRNYGERYDGRLTSNGVFITASLNSPVRAIASGQVIFANWLRGYGNMIIISHNGGYMTLYAHNNALFKQVGDTVTPGEEIALVGNSGGLSASGLYFEIRYKGKTRDPAQWCR